MHAQAELSDRITETSQTLFAEETRDWMPGIDWLGNIASSSQDQDTIFGCLNVLGSFAASDFSGRLNSPIREAQKEARQTIAGVAMDRRATIATREYAVQTLSESLESVDYFPDFTDGRSSHQQTLPLLAGIAVHTTDTGVHEVVADQLAWYAQIPEKQKYGDRPASTPKTRQLALRMLAYAFEKTGNGLFADKAFESLEFNFLDSFDNPSAQAGIESATALAFADMTGQRPNIALNHLDHFIRSLGSVRSPKELELLKFAQQAMAAIALHEKADTTLKTYALINLDDSFAVTEVFGDADESGHMNGLRLIGEIARSTKDPYALHKAGESIIEYLGLPETRLAESGFPSYPAVKHYGLTVLRDINNALPPAEKPETSPKLAWIKSLQAAIQANPDSLVMEETLDTLWDIATSERTEEFRTAAVRAAGALIRMPISTYEVSPLNHVFAVEAIRFIANDMHSGEAVRDEAVNEFRQALKIRDPFGSYKQSPHNYIILALEEIYRNSMPGVSDRAHKAIRDYAARHEWRGPVDKFAQREALRFVGPLW